LTSPSFERDVFGAEMVFVIWDGSNFFEIATPAFGGLAMTIKISVIARSKATKQSLLSKEKSK
jgi:hypothetical protein